MNPVHHVHARRYPAEGGEALAVFVARAADVQARLVADGDKVGTAAGDAVDAAAVKVRLTEPIGELPDAGDVVFQVARGLQPAASRLREAVVPNKVSFPECMSAT